MTKPRQIRLEHAERLQNALNAQMRGELFIADGSYPRGCLYTLSTALCLLLLATLLVSQL